jgi:hypothetical protein
VHEDGRLDLLQQDLAVDAVLRVELLRVQRPQAVLVGAVQVDPGLEAAQGEVRQLAVMVVVAELGGPDRIVGIERREVAVRQTDEALGLGRTAPAGGPTPSCAGRRPIR